MHDITAMTKRSCIIDDDAEYSVFEKGNGEEEIKTVRSSKRYKNSTVTAPFTKVNCGNGRGISEGGGRSEEAMATTKTKIGACF